MYIPLFCTMAGSKSSLHIPTGSPRPLPLILVGDDDILSEGACEVGCLVLAASEYLKLSVKVSFPRTLQGVRVSTAVL